MRILFLCVLASLLTGCGSSNDPAYTADAHIVCISSVDGSKSVSPVAHMWAFQSNGTYHGYSHSGGDVRFFPRTGDSCEVYFVDTKDQ